MNDREPIKIVNQKPKKQREKEPNPFEAPGISGTIYSMLHDMVCILAFIVVFFVLVARLVGVSGSSMYPTLVGANENDDIKKTTGDYLILRSNFISSSYEQGDIVVACVPTFENGKPLVKRVIATGGQTVSFRIGEDMQMHVYVDDVLQPEDYINEPMSPLGLSSDNNSFTVPEGCYYLMGDNRNHSADSRMPNIGAVDERYIVGKALCLVFPGQDTLEENKRDFKRLGDIYD